MGDSDVHRLLESLREMTSNLTTLRKEIDLLLTHSDEGGGTSSPNPPPAAEEPRPNQRMRPEDCLPVQWLHEAPTLPPFGIDLKKLLEPVFDRLNQLALADRFVFFECEKDRQSMTARASRGFRWDDFTAFSLAGKEGIVGQAFSEARPVIVSGRGANAGDDPLLSRFPVLEAIAVPVHADGSVAGVLYAGRTAPIPFETRDLALLTLLAERIGVWVHATGHFTQMHEQMERLKAAEEQLLRSEKAQALSEIARGIAHDVNNVLAIILGTTELMLTRTQNAATREGLEVIEEAAWRGAETVRRLQGFTAARGKEEFLAVDLNAAILDAVGITRPRWKDEAEAQSLRLEVVTDLGEVPRVLGNPVELREMVVNLLFNALDAMPRGGRVVITTRLRGDTVEMTISDTGIGMSEDTSQRIFNPFFTTKGLQHLGLGLAVVHAILIRHRARVEVTSQEGEGTTFVVRFPAAAAASTIQPTPISVETPSVIEMRQPVVETQRIAHILVIENEVLLRAVLVEILTSLGHTVRWAPDGREGLVLFEKEEFDVVFTDLSMPEVSGWEVARTVKKKNPRVPVILVTGWGHQLDSQRLVESGVDLVVAKPFQMERVLSALANALALCRLPSDRASGDEKWPS